MLQQFFVIAEDAEMLVTCRLDFDEEMLELFLVEQKFAYIILVRSNLLSIALAKCWEQT